MNRNNLSLLLDAADQLTFARNHIELIAYATSHTPGDAGCSGINVTAETAIEKINAALALMETARKMEGSA